VKKVFERFDIVEEEELVGCWKQRLEAYSDPFE